MKTPAWETALWAEIEALPLEQQIVVTGEWITYITGVLLPALAVHRREAIVDALAEPDMDAGRLADLIGGRREAIVRLASEGRQQRRHAAAVA